MKKKRRRAVDDVDDEEGTIEDLGAAKVNIHLRNKSLKIDIQLPFCCGLFVTGGGGC